MRKYFGYYSTRNKLQILIGLYLSILMVSLAVFLMIPSKNFLEPAVVDESNYLKAERAARTIYDAAQADSLDQVDGVQIRKQWTFEFTGSQLELVNPGSESLDILIVVEKKELNDGKVKLTNYATMTVVEGMDFTDKINAPQAALDGSKLMISGPARSELELYRAGDFVNTQFSKDGQRINKMSNRTFLGHQLLYLAIPNQVQLNYQASGMNVIFKQ